METEKLIINKKRLVNDIQNLLDKFLKENGVSVENIEIFSVNSIGNPPISTVTNIKLFG